MSRVICDSSRRKRTWETDVQSNNLKLVYDLANAGTRSRFTILTRFGPLLVHNSGYCTGAAKFQAFCEQYGVDMTLERAQEIIQLYRRSNPEVKRLWYDIGKAAVDAVNGTPRQVGPLEYYMEHSTLCTRLPSGRRLRYRNAHIVEGKYGPEVAAVDPRSGGMRNVSLPILVENADQAASRDLLADALIRCHAEGLPVVLHVHDEIVLEVDEDDDESGERLRQIMCDGPAWSRGLPIHAKGDSHRRYVK